MAFWIWGSPKMEANANASSPATAPSSIPRTSRERTMVACPLVAGEAEEVPGVVHELVDGSAGEQRRGAFFGADEVDQHEHDHAGEDRVRHELARRDDGGRCCGSGVDGHVRHLV